MLQITAEFAKTIHCEIITQYEFILPFLQAQLGRSIAKQLRQSLITSMLPVLKSFIQRRLKVKSRDCRSALPNRKHSRPYNKIEIHLALTSSKMNSSEAKFSSFPNRLNH